MDNHLTDAECESLLRGRPLRTEPELSQIVARVAWSRDAQDPTPVGAALAEFVDTDGSGCRTNDVPTDARWLDAVQVDVTAEPVAAAPNPRRRVIMLRKKISAAVLATIVGVAFLGSVAAADTELDDGDYTLMLPGIGSFDFTIDSESETETVVAVAAPEGYDVDDDDPDKAAWKDAASLEVEVKTAKVEGDYDWTGGDAVLNLPDGGSITITEPDGGGNFTVTASGGWYAFGDGRDWVVADSPDITTATRFFAVEADHDGLEIKPVDEPGDGFLNDLFEDEEEEDEVEVEDEEDEEEEEDVEVEADDDDDGGKARGRGRGDD